MQTVYQTDGEGYYVGEEVAFDDPLTPGAVLIPAGCVVDAPPQAGQNQIAKREGGEWVLVPDYRGTVYWLPDRSRNEVTERGIPLPQGALLAEPPKPLAQVQAEKLAQLERAYETAVQQPVAYMGTTFQADYDSQTTLTKTLTALTPLGAVPQGFAWLDTNNNAVPMTLAELAGLAATMLNQGWVAFQNKQAKKQAARDAQTADDVNAVTW